MFSLTEPFTSVSSQCSGDKNEEGQTLNGQGDDSFQDKRGEGEPAAAALED